MKSPATASLKPLRSSPKKILISHVYSSDNKGDAALTSVLIDDLQRKYSAADLTILRLESVKKNARFEGVPEEPAFMYYALNRYKSPLLKLVYAMYMISVTLLWALWFRLTQRRLYLPKHLAHIAEIYAQAELIVPVGGGYIRSRPGLMNRWNIPLLLHPLLFGYILGKPTVLYAQSFGPFQNNFERRLVAFVLKRMTLILVREDTSVKLLKKLGITNNVRRAIDSGFLLRRNGSEVDIRKLYHIAANKLLIGVTVRSWLGGEAQERYEVAIAKALDHVVATTSAHIIFIPQVTATKGDDDRLVSHRVRAHMYRQKEATLITDTPDHHQIKALYDGLDVLLGTRFHSVIFSLTSHVPVLAIEYEHKTSGIMHDLALDQWVIKIEDIAAPILIEGLQNLFNEQRQYREHLRAHLPPYIRQAQKNADMLAQAYSAATKD